MKNIAFITSEIWSDYNPEGIVAKKILNGFLEQGYNVDVFTTKTFSYEKTFIFTNKVPEIFDKILKNLIGLEKIFFVYKTFKYLKKHHSRYDIIITRSEPLAIHLVNLYLKTNAKKIAMFSDVGYLNPYYGKWHFLKQKISYWIEKKLSYECNLITHTNQFVIDEYVKNDFPSHIFYEFPNPLEKQLLDFSFKKEKKEHITLAYTGSLYGNRNPDRLFEYLKLQKNNNFTLYLIGAVRNMYYEKGRFGKVGEYLKNKELLILEEKINSFGLLNKIKILPFMNKQELNKFILEEVDILINIDAYSKTNLFLSSKIVDYLQYNLPILNISTIGASVSFLKKVDVNYYMDYNREFIFTLEEIINTGKFVPNKKKINQFTSISLIENLVKKIS